MAVLSMNKSQDVENLLLNPEKVPDLALQKDHPYTKLSSVQPKSLAYFAIDQLNSAKFEQDLTALLKTRVEKIRIEEPKVALNEKYHLPLLTKWNSELCEKIGKGLLVTLESFSYKIRPYSPDVQEAEDFKNQALVDLRNFKAQLAAEIGPNKILYGFPLRFTHMDIEKIWEEIKATEFYDKFSEDLEFILTSAAFAYPNAFCSVWVFAGFVYLDN